MIDWKMIVVIVLGGVATAGILGLLSMVKGMRDSLMLYGKDMSVAKEDISKVKMEVAAIGTKISDIAEEVKAVTVKTADYPDIRDRALRHITAESHIRLETFLNDVNSIKQEIRDNREATRRAVEGILEKIHGVQK